MNTVSPDLPEAAEEADGGPLPDRLYRRLRLEILNGELKPGQLLRQEELAQRCRVSRVPLREAMNRLEAEDLVVLRPRRGYAVRALEQSDIVEIFALRAVIEAHAGEIAALARSPVDIRAVGAVIEAMEALDPAEPENIERWTHLNYRFHSALIAACRRRRVIRIAEALRASVEPYIRADVATRITERIHEANEVHRAIFEAFRAGDARGLAELSRRHVEDSADRLLAGLRERAAAAPRQAGRAARRRAPAA